jgi:hypothetical protein
MGTFISTFIFTYHLLFANQGKQTSIFRFHLQQKNGSLPFPSSASKQNLPFSVSAVFPVYVRGGRSAN